MDGLRFEDVSQAWGVDHLGMSYAAAYGDLDSDGDLDLVVCNLDETVSIYRNECRKTHHWLEVRLRGTASHSHGWGATVRVKTASGWRVRQMNPATGFLSCNDPRLHFGLGADDTIEAVEVRWPSGRFQRVERPTVDQVLTITEPAAEEVVRGSPEGRARAPAVARVSRPRTPHSSIVRAPTISASISATRKSRTTIMPASRSCPANSRSSARESPWATPTATATTTSISAARRARPAHCLSKATTAGSRVLPGHGMPTPIAKTWVRSGSMPMATAGWISTSSAAVSKVLKGDDVFQDRLYLNDTPPAARPLRASSARSSLPDARHNPARPCARRISIATAIWICLSAAAASPAAIRKRRARCSCETIRRRASQN